MNKLKSELLAEEIRRAIKTISNTSDLDNIKANDIYKEIIISFNNLIKKDFKEKFDFEHFETRRRFYLDTSKEELNLLNTNSGISSSFADSQLRISILQMLVSLEETFNFKTGEFV